MSEVMISRRSGGGSSGDSGLVTTYVCSDINWVVPKSKDGNFYIRLIGAGGTPYKESYLGGGSGMMNNDVLQLSEGDVIPITVGIPYWVNGAGGTTSFGTYLSGNGGSFMSGGSGGFGGTWGRGGTAYQFGGGACNSGHGGNGGVWGGGGTGRAAWSGGNGGTYGGGGGTAYSNSSTKPQSGNGGTYGGGGGAGTYTNSSRFCKLGYGGEYGGNGGGYNSEAENGVNTAGWTNVGKDEISNSYLTGYGLRGTSADDNKGYGGGGGFGGNGGSVNISYGGGGGGYGSNGGNSSNVAGGAGGGYGGDGEDAPMNGEYRGAAGGGYGKVSVGSGGGGGYYCPGGGINRHRTMNITGGTLYLNSYAGGGIGIWDRGEFLASYGSGAYSYGNVWMFFEPGVCIIQYYV